MDACVRPCAHILSLCMAAQAELVQWEVLLGNKAVFQVMQVTSSEDPKKGVIQLCWILLLEKLFRKLCCCWRGVLILLFSGSWTPSAKFRQKRETVTPCSFGKL